MCRALCTEEKARGSHQKICKLKAKKKKRARERKNKTSKSRQSKKCSLTMGEVVAGVSYGALFSILVRMIEWSRKSDKYCSSAACTLCRPSRTLQPPLRRASPPSTGRRRRTLRRCHTRALLLRQTARSQGFRHRTRFLSGRSILLGWAYFH